MWGKLQRCVPLLSRKVAMTVSVPLRDIWSDDPVHQVKKQHSIHPHRVGKI